VFGPELATANSTHACLNRFGRYSTFVRAVGPTALGDASTGDVKSNAAVAADPLLPGSGRAPGRCPASDRAVLPLLGGRAGEVNSAMRAR